MSSKRPHPFTMPFLFVMLVYFFFLHAPACNSQDTIEAHEGGAISVACTERPFTLDPQKANLPSERWVIEQIYDGLLEYDPNDRIIPVLAESLPEMTSKGGFLFRLKDGVRFHDGSALTAEDVVFTIKRLLDPVTQCRARPLFQALKEVRAVGQNSIEIMTGDECPDILELFSRIESRPLSKGVLERLGSSYGQVAAVGTGPFRLVEWDKEREIVLERSPFSKGGQPPLYKVIFRIPEPGSNPITDLRYGRTDLMSCPSPKDASRLAAKSAYKVVSKPGQKICQIYLNTNQYPFNREQVRRAISLAIDRQAICDGAFYGFATPADSCLPPWHRYHDPKTFPPPYDLNQAAQLLAKEGFTPESPLSFSLLYTNANPFRPVAILCKEQLARIGVHVNLVPLAKEELFAFVYGREGHDRSLFQAALEDWEEWHGGGGVEQFTWQLYHPLSSENKLGPMEYQWFQVLTEAAHACDPAERESLFKKVSQQIDAEQITIYLCFPHRIWAARSWVSGDFSNSLGSLCLERTRVR